MNPPSFRANTRMPNFFYLENFVDVSGPKPPTAAQKKMNEDGRIENDTMINSIVAYLYDEAQPGRGPAGRGPRRRRARRRSSCPSGAASAAISPIRTPSAT